MLVFVYGTLKKGYGNHWLLEDSKFIGYGYLEKANVFEYTGYYPLVSLKPYKSKYYGVCGEVYEITNDTLKALDVLEGYPHHYNRMLVDIQVEDRNAKAYVYHIDDYDGNDIIEEGHWL